MKLDPAELVNQSLTLIRKDGLSWLFRFSGGDVIFTDQPWRLITDQGVFVSSQDDMEAFSTPETVNAVDRIIAELQGEYVTGARYDQCTGDLAIEVSENLSLQFLQLSSCHEAWRLHLHEAEFICLGGGALAEFPRPHPV